MIAWHGWILSSKRERRCDSAFGLQKEVDMNHVKVAWLMMKEAVDCQRVRNLSVDGRRSIYRRQGHAYACCLVVVFVFDAHMTMYDLAGSADISPFSSTSYSRNRHNCAVCTYLPSEMCYLSRQDVASIDYGVTTGLVTASITGKV